jgi:rhodanese-related sulfurtransferase
MAENEWVKFATQNLWLIGLALGSGVMLVWPMIQRGASVTPNEAVMLINHGNALVLDVREDVEFAMSHIADARHVPLSQLASRLNELNKWKNKPVVVNCQSGMRSAKACAVLRKNGFTQVSNLAGGLAAWQSAKLPVTKD